MFENLARNPLLLLLLVLIVVVVFGANRLPGAARSLGRSLRIFKSEVRQMQDEGETTTKPKSAETPIEGRIVDDGTGPQTNTQSRQPHGDA